MTKRVSDRQGLAMDEAPITQETRRKLSLLIRRRLRRGWTYHEILMSTLTDPKSRRDLRKMLRVFRRAPYTKGPSR
jgi:hypothetical protein